MKNLAEPLRKLWTQAQKWFAGRVPANTRNDTVSRQRVTHAPVQPANPHSSPAQTASAESAGTQPARLSGKDLAVQEETEARWEALLNDKPTNQSSDAAQARPPTAEDLARGKSAKDKRGLVFFEDQNDAASTGAPRLRRTIPVGDEHEGPDKAVTPPPSDDDEKRRKQREREDASAALARRVQEQTENQQRQIEQTQGTGNAPPQVGVSDDRKKRMLKFFEDNQPTPTRNDPEHTRGRSRTLGR